MCHILCNVYKQSSKHEWIIELVTLYPMFYLKNQNILEKEIVSALGP